MVGERILGRFVIEDRIGSGGFGTVYRAWDERLQRPVAVKVIDHEGAPRVMREAQAVARLAHRNIATLYELASENGHAYLVSELIEGDTLRYLGRAGELSDRLVAEVGADAASALAHAHRHGVVHRDVKPENIMVPAGEAKLVDFGIARIAGEPTLTETGGVVGTLAYMAPEQADGLRPGPAADVYSLALTLYEALCGEHPLMRAGAAATARAIGEPIAPLTVVRPDLPEAMTASIDDCLDPDPEVRPLASELEAVLSAHASGLDGTTLPPIEAPPGELQAEVPHSHRIPVARIVPAAAVAALTATPLLGTGAPAILLWTVVLIAAIALARPRPALALGAALVVPWLWLGADEPGSALVAAVLVAPMLIPIGTPAAAPLPAAAPALGLAGLAPVYPALAGLAHPAGARAILGAAGYLWLAAFEVIGDRTLMFGPEITAPDGWRESAGAAFSDVLIPLVDGSVLAAAGVWALAAVALPILVRGRTPVLDAIGALIWAAALISAHRVVAGPDADPPGLLFAALVAAVVAAFLARRVRESPTLAGSPMREPGTEAHA
jgi:eukaryotic-like serine/threonine-protein kinase